MGARHIVVDPRDLDPAVAAEVVAALRKGGIVAYPTETFYGLGVDARSRSACERLAQLKGRPADKALPVIVSGIAQLESIASTAGRPGRNALALASRFWPGPLTLVVQAKPGLASVARDGGIAVRASGLPLARVLAEMLSGPITATSANRSGSSPATTADEVLNELPEGIDLVLDGGRCPGGRPSTIVDVRTAKPKLVREGVVPFDEVLRALAALGSP